MLGDHVFEFGEFRFDADAPLLTHSSRSVEIEPRALHVLAVLVKNAGQVVSRDDLLNLVWPGTVVEDGNLTVHISCLRKAFGGNRGGDAYIETISKRGYRFAAPVRQIQPAKPRADRELNRICQLANRYLEQQTPDGCLHAAALFRECLESDPSSIPARVGFAYALLWQYLLGAAPRSETVPTAVTLLSETNEIDRRSAQAQVGLAFCAAGSEWQWQIAEEHSWHAVELSSEGEQDYMTRTWLGGYLVRRGNVELGLGQLRLPVHDPLCPVVWSGLADAYYLARDFPASISVAETALRLYPNDWNLHRSLARPVTTLGDYERALRLLQRAMLLSPTQMNLRADVAYVYALSGRGEQAAGLIARARDKSWPIASIELAKVYTALQEKSAAIDRLEEACAKREWYIADLKQDICFDPLRTAPPFRSLLRQVGV